MGLWGTLTTLLLCPPSHDKFPNPFKSFSTTSKQEGFRSQPEKTAALRNLLKGDDLVVMPCCYDGLSARMVEAAATYGVPDAGLVSAAEMYQSASVICGALKYIPCIGDGDTGYGNPLNVKRTLMKYAQMGLSGIMIEDQVSPKRCGHTKGKQVVGREEAYQRIKAAVAARDEGADIVILARTDSRAILGLDEAIERCRMFRELGADWTFLEAPQSEEEMITYCNQVDGPKLANMLEFGKTPILPPQRLKEIGYKVAAYPLTLLSASAKAMKESLELLKQKYGQDVQIAVVVNGVDGSPTESKLLEFGELQKVVGFPEYYEELDKF